MGPLAKNTCVLRYAIKVHALFAQKQLRSVVDVDLWIVRYSVANYPPVLMTHCVKNGVTRKEVAQDINAEGLVVLKLIICVRLFVENFFHVEATGAMINAIVAIVNPAQTFLLMNCLVNVGHRLRTHQLSAELNHLFVVIPVLGTTNAPIL